MDILVTGVGEPAGPRGGATMTGNEWGECGDPERMFRYLQRSRRCRPTARRLLLFACACARRVAHLNWGDWSAAAIAVAEELADGVEDAGRRGAAEAGVAGAWESARGIITPAEHAVFALPLTVGERFSARDASRAASEAARAAGFAASMYPVPTGDAAFDRRASSAASARRRRARVAEARVQAGLLRDIIPNPFRPVSFDPQWRTSTALSLAQGIYADRAWERLPILADALEDVGTDGDILEHLRGPGPHSLGCNALDLVLGRQ